MQTLAAEQILFWSFVDSAVLWMAGTKQHYHFRGVPHCPILSLELWGLPEPYGSSAVDRSHVFLTFFTSGKAQRVNILTDATPVSPRRYAMARCAAALTAAGLLALVCIGEAVFFYRQYFGWYNWGQLLSPALITLIPELIFALGSGWFLGQVRPCLVYVWMSVPFWYIALPLPDALKIWNGQFFRDYPLALGTLDPAFCIPAGALIVQCTLFAIGIVLLALCPAHFKRCQAH